MQLPVSIRVSRIPGSARARWGEWIFPIVGRISSFGA